MTSAVGDLEWDGFESIDGGLLCMRSWIASVWWAMRDCMKGPKVEIASDEIMTIKCVKSDNKLNLKWVGIRGN